MKIQPSTQQLEKYQRQELTPQVALLLQSKKVLTNNTAFISFADATISVSTAFTARGALIYKDGGAAICVLDFGSDKTATTTFTVTFPTASSADALIRLT
jgi:hypothetical protein